MSDPFDMSIFYKPQLNKLAIDAFTEEQWEAILQEIEKKSGGLKDAEKIAAQNAISEAKFEYDRNWRKIYNAEYERLWEATKHLDQALAYMMFGEISEANYDGWRADSVDDLTLYLQNNIHEFIGHDVLFNQPDWGRSIHAMLLARRQLEADLEAVEGAESLEYDFRDVPIINTPARLETDLQQLISDLCEVWRTQFGDLGLPRKEGSATNPLLRFLDTVIGLTLRDKNIETKTIANFVRSYLKGANS